jgi:hypothetical protein
MPPNQVEPRLQGQNAAGADEHTALTPELVRQVTDRVYVLLLRDLALARERRRNTLPATLRGDE